MLQDLHWTNKLTHHMFFCDRKLIICNWAKKRDLCINDDDLEYLNPTTQSQYRIPAEKMKLRGIIFLLLMVETFAMEKLRQAIDPLYFFKRLWVLL